MRAVRSLSRLRPACGPAGGLHHDHHHHQRPARSARRACGRRAGDPERRAQVRLELAGLYFQRGQGDTALERSQLALAAKPDLAGPQPARPDPGQPGDQPAPPRELPARAATGARDGGTMHNYGWFLCQQRRFAEGDAQFNAAVAQPQYRDAPRTYLAQGVCQARAGQWGEAERTLSRSYELDPANPVTAFNLSEVLLRRGELERARFYVRRINAQPGPGVGPEPVAGGAHRAPIGQCWRAAGPGQPAAVNASPNPRNPAVRTWPIR
jgi:type IV pilus biogenesis/stability protein PilW